MLNTHVYMIRMSKFSSWVDVEILFPMDKLPSSVNKTWFFYSCFPGWVRGMGEGGGDFEAISRKTKILYIHIQRKGGRGIA